MEMCLPESVIISGTCADVNVFTLKNDFFQSLVTVIQCETHFSSLLLPNVHPLTQHSAVCMCRELFVHVRPCVSQYMCGPD